MNEDRVLQLGEGFRAECDHLNLFVEVLHNGWTAGVYDTRTKQWIEMKRVSSAEEGRARAAHIASLELKTADLRPNWTAL